MKNKRASDYFANTTSPEEREKKVDALLAELRGLVNEGSPKLANPGLRRCRAIVELNRDTRLPIKKQSKFQTEPKVLNSEVDKELLAIRKNHMLALLQERDQIAAAWAYGRTTFILILKVTSDDPGAPYPCHVDLFCKDSRGYSDYLGLG